MIFECLETAIAKPDSPKDALICVVDHDEQSRRTLERLFISERYHVETFSSPAHFLERRSHSGPVCLVLDISTPELDVHGLLNKTDGWNEQVVFLSRNSDFPTCVKAIKSGASDFLVNPVDGKTLLEAVNKAIEKAVAMRALHAERQSARAKLASLTDRETEVMQCVISGMLNKQIASQLGISEKTVKIHRGRVMKKTGCSSVPALLKMTMKVETASHHAAGSSP